MSNTSSVVYLLDVDNTLLDNDRVTVDMRRFLGHHRRDDECRHD